MTTHEGAAAPRKLRRVCVYCGSSRGNDPRYAEVARGFGELLAERGVGVVFGGGRVGLMGAVADGALAKGGEVIGVIPEKLRDRELAHLGVSELFVVDSMHARKTMMAQLADAFVAMPGGYGTLEEIFEVTTWAQLNYHLKPVGLLNVGGYYDRLLEFLAHAAGEGFIRPIHRGLLVADAGPAALLERLARVEIPHIGRWIDNP
jgi:uncharacterized protein (TIGR00730 family)